MTACNRIFMVNISLYYEIYVRVARCSSGFVDIKIYLMKFVSLNINISVVTTLLRTYFMSIIIR